MTNDHTTSVFRRSPGREDRYVPEIVRFVHTWRSAAQRHGGVDVRADGEESTRGCLER